MLNKVSKTSTYNPAAVLTAVDNAYTSNADDAGMASFSLRNPGRRYHVIMQPDIGRLAF